MGSNSHAKCVLFCIYSLEVESRISPTCWLLDRMKLCSQSSSGGTVPACSGYGLLWFWKSKYFFLILLRSKIESHFWKHRKDRSSDSFLLGKWKALSSCGLANAQVDGGPILERTSQGHCHWHPQTYLGLNGFLDFQQINSFLRFREGCLHFPLSTSDASLSSYCKHNTVKTSNAGPCIISQGTQSLDGSHVCIGHPKFLFTFSFHFF